MGGNGLGAKAWVCKWWDEARAVRGGRAIPKYTGIDMKPLDPSKTSMAPASFKG